MPIKTARWLLSGVSFAAAVLALLSPWTAASPFSSPLALWVSKFLALLLGGMSAMILTKMSPLVIILPLLGGVICALPFLGLQQVWKNQRLNLRGAAIGIFLVALGGILISVLTKAASWDPWQVIELALVVALGLLLIRSGLAIMRISGPSFASARLVGWLMFSIGICFSSFVLLPLGILGSVVLYFVLGITFLRLPRLSQ
ncbi:MAG: hypothetical protein U9Q94_07755 [Candidatus Bipolaricaulota bacterium]|nr:hypothetical protein [Candidatus Bipolaricaulota bacterium]